MPYTYVYPRVSHCAEGRCTNEIKRMPQCTICRNFLKLVRSGKNPTNCPWYDHTKDIENFKKKGKSR